MSFSAGKIIKDPSLDFDDWELDEAQCDEEGRNEHKFTLAKEFAQWLINEEAMGDVAKDAWSVTVSGHSNPEGEPVEGWSNDCVTVAVAQQNRE